MGASAATTLRRPPRPHRGAALARRFGDAVGVRLLILVLVGAPVAWLVAMSLNPDPGSLDLPSRPTLAAYGRLGNEWGVLRTTLLVAVAVATLSTVVGATLAWLLARTGVRRKRPLTILVIVVYPAGPMVQALAWATLGAPHAGLLNSWLGHLVGHDISAVNVYTTQGVVAVQSIYQVPVVFLLMSAALRGLDTSLEEASRTLGAGTIGTLRRISTPLVLPAVLSSFVLSFVSALGAFAIPSVLGRQVRLNVATHEVYELVSGYPTDYPLAAAIGTVLVAVTGVLVLMVGTYLRRRSHALLGGKARAGKVVVGRRINAVATVVLWSWVFVSVVLPGVCLVIASLQTTQIVDPNHLTWSLHNFRYVLLEYPETRRAITNSLLSGAVAGAAAVAVALLVALRVERRRRLGRSSAGLENLVMAPQAVPALIFALPILSLVIQSPVRIYGSVVAVMIAFAILFLPTAYRVVAGVASQVDASLEEAARTLGASRPRATRTVLPLLRPGLTAAFLLVFLMSVSEVGAAVLLSSTTSRLIGPATYSFYESGGVTLVSALAVVQLVLVLVLLSVAGRLVERMVA